MQKWGSDEKSTLIITDPEVESSDMVVGKYSSLEIEIVRYPLDVRLTRSEANQLLSRCRPRHLIVPQATLKTKTYVKSQYDNLWILKNNLLQ